MQHITARGGVFPRSGAIVLGILSIYGLGIPWSCLLAFSLWAVYVVSSRIVDGEMEGRNSVENLENRKSPDARKKRILAKKKEKYEKKRRKPADEDEDYIDVGLKRSQELVDENVFGNIDYEAAGAYHGVFAMPVSDSGKLTKRSIPSLKSPQPLLYAFHSRISKREYNQMSPTVLPDSGYPLSPRRSVFDNLQNRSLNSPLNRSWTVKEASMFRAQCLEAHKAISPPTGRYFSRIQHDFSQENRRNIELSAATSTRKDRSLESWDRTRFGKAGDCYTREEIVKVLQEKTASKRKRTMPDAPDSTVLFQDRYSKKRRLEKDIFDESVTEFKKDESINNQQIDVGQVKTTKGQEVSAESSKVLLNEDKQDVTQARNKYGIKENEVESITDDDDMEIDKAKSKRKAEESLGAKKGKKTRGDTADRSKRKDASQAPVSGKKTKKATPVRSIETQTPTKFDESNTSKSNAGSRSNLKTPYKKVFVAGFPSNLKPGSTEKRRKVPFFSGSLGGNENIEIGLEEYGPLGVTSAEYTADKQAAMARVKALLGGNDSSEDRSATSLENNTASTAAIKLDAQPLASSKNSDELTIVTCSTTSFTKLPQTVPSQLPIFGSTTLSAGTDTSADGTTKLPQQSNHSFATPSIDSTAAATSTASANEANPMFSKSQDNAFPLSFGVQTTQATTAATLSPSSAKSSASTVFRQTQQSSFALSGFNFGSQSSSSTSITTSSAPSITFSQPLNVVSKPQTSQPPTLSTGSAAFSQLSQPANSGFGGFSFGSLIGSSQQLPSQTNSVKTQSSTEASKAIIGSSLGTDTAQQQPQTEAQLPLATSASLSFSSVTKPGGFNFGAISSSSSQTSSSTTFGGFSFGAVTTSSSQPSSSSSFGGFKFGTTTTSSSQSLSSTTFGGFSFGSQSKASTNSVSVSSSSAAPLGTSFKFETTKSTASSGFSGFSFNSTPASQDAKAGMPVVGSFNVGVSISSQTSTSASPSIFQIPSATSQLSFAPKVSSEATNLFAAPTTAVGFGSQPQFGTAQSNSIGQLFSTPSCSQTPSLFGTLTQSKSSVGPSFGLSSQSSSAGGSLFPPPSLGGNTSGNFFSAASQNSGSNSTLLGGTSEQNVKTDSIFNGASQGTQQSGLLFAAQPASTAAPLFGTQAAASSFSFGASQSTPAFGSVPSTTSAGTGGGGFLFGSNPQSSSTSAAAIAPFGQTNNNVFGQVGGQNTSGSNPFANSSVFGQAPSAAAATTSSSGFSFGSSSAPFGQTSNNQSSFGASPATFQPITDQPQAGGFNFASAAAHRSASFSFGGTSSGGGFASRPGTPTPFNNPSASATELFASPQPQNAGFALGSGAPSRPTVRGRRRARR